MQIEKKYVKYVKYIKILGLSIDEIKDINIVKKIYKQKSLKLHPDKGGDEEKFKELNNAYSKILELIEKEHNENKKNNIKNIKVNIDITLHDLLINKKKTINVNGNTKILDLNDGFKKCISLSDEIKVYLNLILSSNFQLDHKNKVLRNIIELTYLDTYFVDNFSFFYIFIDGSKYKINYKKNNIINEFFCLPDKCNFLYENKYYKFVIYINVKKPNNTEISLIKKAVSKYTVPIGNNYEFNIFKNNEDNEIKSIINKLENMKLKDLKEFCKNKKIKGYSKYNKHDLILYIRNYFS